MWPNVDSEKLGIVRDNLKALSQVDVQSILKRPELGDLNFASFGRILEDMRAVCDVALGKIDRFPPNIIQSLSTQTVQLVDELRKAKEFQITADNAQNTHKSIAQTIPTKVAGRENRRAGGI